MEGSKDEETYEKDEWYLQNWLIDVFPMWPADQGWKYRSEYQGNHTRF